MGFIVLLSCTDTHTGHFEIIYVDSCQGSHGRLFNDLKFDDNTLKGEFLDCL